MTKKITFPDGANFTDLIFAPTLLAAGVVRVATAQDELNPLAHIDEHGLSWGYDNIPEPGEMELIEGSEDEPAIFSYFDREAWERAAGHTDGDEEQSEPAHITNDDANILRYLAERHPVAKVQIDVAAGACVCRTIVGRRLRQLRYWGYVCNPHGERGGWGLTPDKGLPLGFEIAEAAAAARKKYEDLRGNTR